MIITNIISAIGNNKSIYPLLLRDCGIEVPSKIYVTRKENLKESKIKAKDATREKFIDEYITSVIWLGGIPLVEKIGNKIIKNKNFNPCINTKLFKEEEFQGLEYNIKKFKNILPKEIKDLERIRDNKKYFQKLIAGKFACAIIIPTVLMGYVLPKLNFALTKNIKNKRKNTYTKFEKKPSLVNFSSGKNISFGSNISSTISNLKTVDKMLITDAGLTCGRVGTSRNKEEARTNAFRMIGSIILNFVTPKYIAKFLDNTSKNFFKINVNLDPKILNNKEFLSSILNNTFELPKSSSPKDIFEFIDKKPQSLFAQFLKETDKISYIKNIRDPRKYVDIKNIIGFKKEIEIFISNAKQSENIYKFIKKAKIIKSVNILLNIGISSFLLAYGLPKAQYLFNKITTGSYSDPGLKD